MTIDQFLSEVQKLKNEGKISGNTEMLTYDIVQNTLFKITKISIADDVVGKNGNKKLMLM